jgi:nitroimidazol reductase NimA-like FMN-containing flavoprotein (pyridoxamine 5'-phosphate oxidase superfamily)
MTGQLTPTEMENLLHSQLIGRLACTDGDEPYIVPMAYAYTGTHLVGQTSPGLKLRILRQHPKVCFEVDQLIDLRNWKSVIVYGTFQETPEASMPQARQWLFNRIYPLSTPAQLHGYGHSVETQTADDTRLKPVLFSIDIDRMTGRYERQ